MSNSEGIKTKTIIVADDIASASNEEKLKRRGIAGMIFVFKIAGSIAETGASLEETFDTVSSANNNIRTLGVAMFLHVFYLKLANLLLKLMMMKLRLVWVSMENLVLKEKN